MSSPSVIVDWSSAMATSKTSVTLQVVSNAVLDRRTPVSSAFFKTLSTLPVDNIRYVPWFVMPLYAVPELLPPTADSTSWDFKYAGPMLNDFLDATFRRGRTTMTNFATQPAWMYKNWSHPEYPTNPFDKDVGYARGTELRDPSGRELVDYFKRLLQWIVKGEFVDEIGQRHTGGPAVKLTQWEVFNEPQGCHGMNMSEYTRLYDLVVEGIREAVDPKGEMRFAMGALEQLDELDWARYLLDPSNHAVGAGRDSLHGGLLTFHFYAGASNRTDPRSYEGFFDTCQQYFTQTLRDLVAARDTLSPDTILDCNEMGTILPQDNTPGAPMFPLVYWNAAAAKYAYMFQEFTRLGVEVAGMSQLAGNPVIPEWGITEPQFPSVSILNWTNGEGTARWWTLELLHQEFHPGDLVLPTSVSINPVCGVVSNASGYGNITLTCMSEGAHISSIDFADFGMPLGSCGAYKHNSTCTSPGVTEYVKALCLGRASCSVPSFPTFGRACNSSSESLVVQARCSTGGGSAGLASTAGVAAQAYADKDGTNRRVLLVNQEYADVEVDLSSVISGSKEATLLVVDEASAFGPAREERVDGTSVKLSAFAVGVLKL